MHTECSSEQFEFEGFGRRRVVAALDAGALSSDGGGLLLRHTDRATGLIPLATDPASDILTHRCCTYLVHLLCGDAIHQICG